MDQRLLALLQELEAWDAATSQDRLTVAAALHATISPKFTFDRLETYRLGDQTHEIAFYRHEGCEFALIPGSSRATLGYDRSNPYQPSPAQLDGWQDVLNEYGCTIDSYLDESLTPLRTATILPCFVETVARSFRCDLLGDRRQECYSRVQSFCGDDFRLPTTDEWEYLCAAGTRTLFRWGNQCPATNSYSDKTFMLHKSRNAFGILLNSSTYDSEICQGLAIRGGDGGGSVCGGIGNVISWFPLASSFQVSDEEVEEWFIDDVLVRRVRTIINNDL